MNFHIEKDSKGQATLLIVTVLCVVGTIILMSSLDVFVRDYNHKAKDFNQVLLDETTSSAFAVMETALERRLWEPPPDENCLRSENMEVEGKALEGMSWNVKAKFNFATKNFEMTATGKYKELTSTFKKKIKVMDVSDYLLLSTNSNPIGMSRLYSETAPSALIARDRRIYTRGTLKMGSAIHRANPMTDFHGSPASWPAEWGTIVQGDRMQFGGGIQYYTYVVPKPNNAAQAALLAPYANAYGTPDTHASQWGAGASVFTKDYSKALELKSMVMGGPGSLTKASVAAEVYPIALFGGTPPLEAWAGVDNGTYFNDVDRFSIFNYQYALTNGFGVRMDATCFGKWGALEKVCSNSEHFPKGFKAWRTNAGLDGYLFTSDAVAVPSPTIGWDNLKALEEDANACGAVISTPINPYTDCPVWDSKFLNKYANGDNSGCKPVSTIDLDTVPLNGLNVAALNNPANAGRLLRRIVYLKGPATIWQKDAAGLMLSTVSNNIARKNLSVWIVSEDMVTLKGFQADNTSPLVSNPGKLREIMFNGDTTVTPPTTGKEPLALTILTTERVNLISPQYKPMTPTHLATIWPASGGKIRPKRHNITDFERQEDDGFMYGFRRYVINGLSLISNANTSSGEPFFLQGLWSAPDSSANQFPANQCMVSLNGFDLSTAGVGGPIYFRAAVPSYHSASDSPIPPLGSKFYNGATDFPDLYLPAIFKVQRTGLGDSNREQSEVILNGITMSTNFSAEAPAGLRALNVSLYDPRDGRSNDLPFDLSDKHFVYDNGPYYNPHPTKVSCIRTNAEFKLSPAGADPYDTAAVQPVINNGRQIFVQTAPNEDYRNVGSVVGIDQLVIETKADPSAP